MANRQQLRRATAKARKDQTDGSAASAGQASELVTIFSKASSASNAIPSQNFAPSQGAGLAPSSAPNYPTYAPIMGAGQASKELKTDELSRLRNLASKQITPPASNKKDLMAGSSYGSPFMGVLSTPQTDNPDRANLNNLLPPLPPHITPRNISTNEYFMMAIDEYVNGDRDFSATMFRELLNRDPDVTEALFRLGVIRGRADDFVESELLLRAAYLSAPDSYKLLRNYALILQKQDKMEEALELQKTALRHEKMDKKILLHDIANSLSWLKRIPEALHLYDQLVELDPDNTKLHYNRAINLQHVGLNEMAVASYVRAIEIDPKNVHALTNLASICRNDGEFEKAVQLIERVMALEPDDLDHYGTLSGIYTKWQRIDKLEEIITFLKARAPHDYRTISGEVDLLMRKGRFTDAITLADKGIQEFPERSVFYMNKFECLMQLNQDEAAIKVGELMLTQCLPLVPLEEDRRQIENNWGISQLQFGDFTNGFYHYERRFDEEESVSSAGRFRSFLPEPYLTTPEQAYGKTLMVYFEQGIGDIIMFSRYLPLLAQYAAKIRLLYAGDKGPYDRLFRNYVKDMEVYQYYSEIPKDEGRACDVHCAIMSLPYIFRTTIDTIPPAVAPQLDPALIEQWGERLGPKRKPRVGLVVSGNQLQGNDYNRSSRLSLLKELVTDKADVIMVQKDLRPHDVELAAELGLLHLGKEFGDLADTAAAFLHFDLLIGVETGIMHLAATMGRPTWMLLTTYPDWRYFRNRSDSPFYPSVRLFRQKTYHDWQELAARVRPIMDNYLLSLG